MAAKETAVNEHVLVADIIWNVKMCVECKGVACLNYYEMNKSENEWLQ